ncbi:MAG: PQQ-binding-like beta-propeller repeat protein [Acidobacteriota bacterium]
MTSLCQLLRRIGLVSLLLVTSGYDIANADWTRFRGPDGSGIAAGPAIPLSYSATENLQWRVPLIGKGVSSPIVSGDRIYVTAYTGYGEDLEAPGSPENLVRHLLAFDRSSGKELWRFSVPTAGEEDPFQGFITQHGYASSTPVTDGERIYTLFGKSGLVAVNRDGQEVWRRDLGRQSSPTRWGDASSPILVGDVLVVNAGILGRKIAGIDKRSGELLWAVRSPGFTNSWSTPAVARIGEKAQVLAHFPFKIVGIDPQNGEVLWSAKTPLDDATSPSIVVHQGVAYLMGSRAGHAMAVKIDGRGDVSESHVLWQTRTRAGITTPVIAGKALYWTTSGIFMALSLETGELVYRTRLPRLGGPTGGFPNADYSSPIVVGDRIVQFTRNGESYVIQAGESFELLGHNPAFEGDSSSFSATPAVSRGELFMRSEGYLYSIGASSAPRDAQAQAQAR